MSVVLKDFIRKHIINHFHRYVQYLDNENIENEIKSCRCSYLWGFQHALNANKLTKG